MLLCPHDFRSREATLLDYRKPKSLSDHQKAIRNHQALDDATLICDPRQLSNFVTPKFVARFLAGRLKPNKIQDLYAHFETERRLRNMVELPRPWYEVREISSGLNRIDLTLPQYDCKATLRKAYKRIIDDGCFGECGCNHKHGLAVSLTASKRISTQLISKPSIQYVQNGLLNSCCNKRTRSSNTTTQDCSPKVWAFIMT